MRQIIPRSRLLFWFAVVTVPSALLMAVAPAFSPLYGLLIGAFCVISAIDAAGAHHWLGGLGISLPSVVRFSKDRPGKLEVRLRNQSGQPHQLRLALDLPAEIPLETEEMDILLPADSEWSRLLWTCTPAKRGKYGIQSVYVEAVSSLGLWGARKQVPVQSEIRVYPNLSTERHRLAALFLNRGVFGLHAVRQVGKGRDFEKLREYIPGDSFDDVHWKATARHGRPITKVFQIERTQEIYVVVDASRLSAREFVPGTSILERFVTAALVLGLAAEQQGDLFGLMTLTDKVENFIRARNGKTHYSICRDALYNLHPWIVTPDFEELCSFVRLRLRRRALIVFLTSLDDPVIADSFIRSVELIRKQHLILVNMVRQAGCAPLFTHDDVKSIDDLYEHLGGHLRFQKLRQLEKTLQRQGIHFSLVDNERLSADLVSHYLSVKQRQLI